ncbi:MAG: ABC transporter substrate-binding protein [Alphaproteobacteria bacterium]|nr:ABC transporter substrate-binding protein [Alphaproteobacteria bacterium]
MTRVLRNTALALVFVAFAAPVSAAQGGYIAHSETFIRKLAEQAIGTVAAKDLSGEQRRQKFRSLLRDAFAVPGIARFVIGRYWRSADDKQREEYLVLFEDVIVNTWADRFSDYSGQKFEVREAIDARGPQDTENSAIVRSVFYTDPTTPVRVEWRVANVGEIYKIVDVVVEGVSMANTHRDEFATVIRNNGGNVEGLLVELRRRREATK